MIRRMDDPLTREPTSKGVLFVRYGIPAVLIVAGFVCYAVAPESSRNEGSALFIGSGVSVLLLNLLYRIGVSGDADRDRENEAREYFSEHGAWPDEDRKPGRRWNLPEGVATPESEAEERRRAEKRRHSE
jgi:hypothetical protein